MLNVALTGGIAAGKSAVSQRLVELGAVLIDADAIAREVVEPGTEGLAAIVAAFGPEILCADGSLDRTSLGALVFADAAEREKLNAIVHPLVRAEAARRSEAAPKGAVIVQDIPLLVETGQESAFDLVVVIEAPLEERVRRMVDDRGMAEADARARIAAQATDTQRAAAADAVIVNSGSLVALRQHIDEFWEKHIDPSTGHAG
ncbi:dephospho-CoA kinase [Paeniglutamicibacter antarcticus]